MAKPKPKDNKAKDVEKPARVKCLHAELGKLTFEMAKQKASWEAKAKRSNEIGAELEKLDG